MRQLFVFCAAEETAQRNLARTIERPVSFKDLEGHLSTAKLDSLRALVPGQESFYAWGATPKGGTKNPKTWSCLRPGDFMLAFYRKSFHYIATVIAPLHDEELAETLWGRDPAGQTWEYMYLLSTPKPVHMAATDAALQGLIAEHFQGFSRIDVEKVLERFESVEDYVQLAFGYSAFASVLEQLVAEVEQALEVEPTGGEGGLTQQQSIERVLRAVLRRKGQQKFRSELMRAYEGRCAVTNCKVEAILEAAHIVPYSSAPSNEVSNGLLLRADIHTLFDLGKLRVSVDRRVVLTADLEGSDYWQYNKQDLRLPKRRKDYPSEANLGLRWETYLTGSK